MSIDTRPPRLRGTPPDEPDGPFQIKVSWWVAGLGLALVAGTIVGVVHGELSSRPQPGRVHAPAATATTASTRPAQPGTGGQDVTRNRRTSVARTVLASPQVAPQAEQQQQSTAASSSSSVSVGAVAAPTSVPAPTPRAEESPAPTASRPPAVTCPDGSVVWPGPCPSDRTPPSPATTTPGATP